MEDGITAPDHPAKFEKSGFTLIEITMAIGIVSFAFMALIALFPMGLQSEKTSDNETSCINLMHSLIADIAATPVSKAGGANTASGRFGLAPLPANVTTPISVTTYFNDSQQKIAAAGAVYRVVMTYYPAKTTTAGAYASPGVLIQIFTPAASNFDASRYLYETYATFSPYSL